MQPRPSGQVVIGDAFFRRPQRLPWEATLALANIVVSSLEHVRSKRKTANVLMYGETVEGCISRSATMIDMTFSQTAMTSMGSYSRWHILCGK